MKILLIGEVYSENLGDGVLCQTVNKVILSQYPDAKIIMFDISGKTDYDAYYESFNCNQMRKMYYRLAYRIPVLNQNKIFKAIGKDAERHIRVVAGLKSLIKENTFDLAIFAGGSLFMNYFAGVIYLIVNMLSRAKINVLFHACGMSDLSDDSEFLLKRALKKENVKWISLRDSYERFVNKFESQAVVERTNDTALSCRSYFEPRFQKTTELGIGVIDRPELYLLQKNMIQSFLKSDLNWRIFTNGSITDYRTAVKILDEINVDEEKKKKLLLPRPGTPGELVQTIVEFEYIISFRMHSQIIASSYGIPSFGIVWDNKVFEMYSKLGFPECCVDPKNVEIEEMVNIIRYVDPDALKNKAQSCGKASEECLLKGIEYCLLNVPM